MEWNRWKNWMKWVKKWSEEDVYLAMKREQVEGEVEGLNMIKKWKSTQK